MIDRSTGKSIIVECPNCGWGWAAYNPGIEDETAYEIWLCPGNTQSPENLRLIAGIANINFLQAKRMMSREEPVMLYKARGEAVSEQSRVQRIQSIAGKLADAGISYFITPDFKYEI